MPGPRLQDKICITTGGGSGFGKGIVEKFIDEGAKVLIWDINPTSASDLSSTLPKGTAIPFIGDVSKLDDWNQALDAVLKEWDVLDVIVNNTGVVHRRGSSHEVCEI